MRSEISYTDMGVLACAGARVSVCSAETGKASPLVAAMCRAAHMASHSERRGGVGQVDLVKRATFHGENLGHAPLISSGTRDGVNVWA